MGPEDRTYLMLDEDVSQIRSWRLRVTIVLLGRAKALLGEMEHPALGDIERLIERLREEQAELQRRNPK